MIEIKLLNLTLTNFKGIKHFELPANGLDIKALGDNGTGKTTLSDGFRWLLFDKDSQDKKDFQIKTLKNGEPISKLNHEVEAVLEVGGKRLTLKKVYKEKWSKKRGTPTESFTGHTTNYFIDGVPSKKGEFTEKVAGIVDEDAFRLLTSPTHFNRRIHWKDRRDLLLDIAGDVTDEEIAESKPDLSRLIDTLEGREIEDHQKVIAAKKKEINDELDIIPVRIDEIHRGLPDLSGLDNNEITLKLENISGDLEAKQQRINDIRNGSETNSKRKEISDIDLEINRAKNEHEQQGQQELFSLKAKLQEEQSNISILQSRIKSFEQQKNMNLNSIKDWEERMQELREQWKEKNTQVYDHENNCECPTCGQDLPEEQIEVAVANFNKHKAGILEAINEKGVDLKEKVNSLDTENEAVDKEIEKLNSQVEQKQKAVAKLETSIQDMENDVQPVTENPLYQKLMNDRQALVQDIESNQQSVEESVQAVQTEIQELKSQQENLQMDLGKINSSEQAHERIAELEEQEKELTTEYEELEKELFLTEEYTKVRVELLTDKINSKFKYARFNLFKENINGGIEETCETTYHGVPYSSGLNNAAQINVGLDIINTLSEHYGVRAPIFIDNAESVVKLIDIDAQIISLVVSESDKALRIETKSESEVA